MKSSLAAATALSQCRAHYPSATALSKAGAWGAWPAGLVALPLALASTGANAATITIGASCVLIGPPAACLASNLPNKSSNSIEFAGGVLTMDATGQTYVLTPVTLDTSPGNTINQAGHDNIFSGVFQNKSTGGNIKITNADPTTGNPLTLGSVTLNGKNTYTGSTTVDQRAKLILGSKGTIASSSTLADNGTFDISVAGNTTIKDLSGNGTVTLGANTLTLSAAASMFSGGIGAVGDKGGLTVNGGMETLSGNNNYTGITTIGASGTLDIAGAGSIASSKQVTDNGTFDISKATGDVTITTLAGSGTVNLGGNSVILSKASTTFSGGINGTGGVAVKSGAETFSNANTYSGTTTISVGAALLLTKAGSIANSSVADNGTFDISGTKGTSIVSLSGATGSVNLGTQVLTLSNASGIFAGGINGSGTKNGITIAAGTETLNGANLFKGTTTVSPGATLTGIGSVGGNLINNGTLKPFNPVTGSPGTFTGGGNYSQSATGSLNIAIGGTTVGKYGQLSVSGTVALAGSLDVDLVNSFVFPQGKTTYDILNYKVGKNTVSGDFSSVSLDGSACTGDGLDKWICGVGLTFTESFTSGALDLVVAQTPEPSTFAILASGLLGLFGLRRRWRRGFG